MIDEKVKKWVIKAIEDFTAAEKLLNFPDREIVTSAVCFHCQQFVEKILKAYLASTGIDFGRTHNLRYLLKLCSDNDADFSKLEVGSMTFYAIDIRYPDEFYVPSVDEAHECFKIVLQVKDAVFKKMNIEREL